MTRTNNMSYLKALTFGDDNEPHVLLTTRAWRVVGRFAYHDFDTIWIAAEDEDWCIVMKAEGGKVYEEAIFTSVEAAANYRDAKQLFEDWVCDQIDRTSRSMIDFL